MAKFWGLKVNLARDGLKYTFQDDVSITGAACSIHPMDETPEGEKRKVQLKLHQNKVDFLLCTFWPSKGLLQVPLNLQLRNGETVAFSVNSSSKHTSWPTTIHLTGWILNPPLRTKN